MDELVRKVVGAAYEVANTPGPGFLEKVYERAPVHKLRLRGSTAETQAPFPVKYKEIAAGDYYADIVVEDVLILELKRFVGLNDGHPAQGISYLRATNTRTAFRVNFQNAHVEWRRVFNEY
jgi:GxxExxY protein